MSSRFIMPFADVGSGIKPSSGAQLFFFEVDGVTPKDTYSDQLATPTPNSNPVIADSNGVFGDIYINNTYKVTLEDKNGSQIFGGALIEEASGFNDLSLSYTFKSVAEMQSTDINFPEGKVIFWQGYYDQSDGGGNWGIVKSGAHTEDGGSIFSLGVSTYIEADVKGSNVDSRLFGAVCDGATDDALSTISALAYCKPLGFTVVIPEDSFFGSQVEVKGDLYCAGYIITDGTVEHVVTFEADSRDTLASGSFTGLEKNSNQIIGLDNRAGQTLNIRTNDMDILRATYGQTYKKRSTHRIISPDGIIAPALPYDYTSNITEMYAYIAPKPITVSLKVKVKSDTVVDIDNIILKCERSYVTFTGFEVLNETDNYKGIKEGIGVFNCTNIQIDNPKMHGFHYPNTGYPIYIGNTTYVEINNPEIHHSRKSIDGNGGRFVTVNGGNCSAPIGSHWGFDYTFNDVVTSGGAWDTAGLTSVQAFFGAGGNYTLNNCKGSIRSATGTTGLSLFAVRSDALECFGKLIVKNCSFDVSNCPLSLRASLVTISTITNGLPNNYGKDVSFPDLISVKDNVVRTGTLTTSVNFVNIIFTDTINSHYAPEKIEVDGNDISGPNAYGAFLYDAKNPQVRTNVLSWDIADIGNVTMYISARVRAQVTNMNGRVITSSGVMFMSEFKSSVITRFGRTFFDESLPDYERDDRTKFYNCTLSSPTSNWDYRGWYEFDGCEFLEKLTWAVVDPEVYVVRSNANQGVSQLPNFDLNGVYRTIT